MYKIDSTLLVKMLLNCDFKEGQVINVLYKGDIVETFKVKEVDGEQFLVYVEDNYEVACSYLTTNGFEFEIVE